MLKHNKKLEEIGTWIHGIGSSEHTDSSGEKLLVNGIDVSSIDEMTINWEHKTDQSSQIVGKVIEAKKILKESDCENEHHMYFWKKAHEVPYLYIKAVLFDKYGHNGAQDVAAMFKFSHDNFDGKQQKCVLGFSIEGSKVDKDGHIIKKSIARRMTVTQNPCNKVCVAEYLEDPNATTKNVKEEVIKKVLQKAEAEVIDMKKNEKLEKAGIFGQPEWKMGSGVKMMDKTPKSTYTGGVQDKSNTSSPKTSYTGNVQDKTDFSTPKPAGMTNQAQAAQTRAKQGAEAVQANQIQQMNKPTIKSEMNNKRKTILKGLRK
jgi:hypothetical protein